MKIKIVNITQFSATAVTGYHKTEQVLKDPNKPMPYRPTFVELDDSYDDYYDDVQVWVPYKEPKVRMCFMAQIEVLGLATFRIGDILIDQIGNTYRAVAGDVIQLFMFDVDKFELPTELMPAFNAVTTPLADEPSQN